MVRRHHEEMTEPPAAPEPETEPEETEPTAEPTVPPDPNPYGRLDFQYNKHNYLTCLRTDSYSGVEVSAFQGDIDWKKVARSGIDFAIIRLGYRGYGSGKLWSKIFSANPQIKNASMIYVGQTLAVPAK